jgi:hypothetical protein
LALVLCLGIACSAPAEPPPPAEGDAVVIRNRRVAVEVAVGREQQSLGLGRRDSLPWDHGMLFIYDKPAFYAFWMKEMRFSIDIVWIRGDRIVDITHRVPFAPGENGPTVRPRELADRVLEVPAGYAEARGWRVGDRVTLALPGA